MFRLAQAVILQRVRGGGLTDESQGKRGLPPRLKTRRACREHFFGGHLGQRKALRIENKIVAVIGAIVLSDGGQKRSVFVIKGDKNRLVV